MGYTGEDIYQKSFSNSRQIEIVWDLEFNKDYSYKEIRTKVEKSPFFSLLKLEPFIKNIFDNPIRNEEKLSAALPTLFVTHFEDANNKNSFFSIYSDNNSLLF